MKTLTRPSSTRTSSRDLKVLTVSLSITLRSLPRYPEGYLSITAVAAISTRNSGLTKPACTHARAGGFSGKYVP